MKKNICIIGAGGCGKEILCLITDLGRSNDVYCFMETDEFYKKRIVLDIRVEPISNFNSEKHKAIVAVGDPHGREKIIKQLPKSTKFETLIHPNVSISKWNKIGEGSIICTGCILTCDIELGQHAYINSGCTIAHDCKIGDYFTAAPSVNISGKCEIGKRVYIGTNSAIRDKISICDEVIIGMGSVVVKDINEPGIYIGNPAKKLIKK